LIFVAGPRVSLYFWQSTTHNLAGYGWLFLPQKTVNIMQSILSTTIASPFTSGIPWHFDRTLVESRQLADLIRPLVQALCHQSV
jgi:hypothetical protein